MSWIAVKLPQSPVAQQHPESDTPDPSTPPSFNDAQFGIILRRQRQRPADNSGLKSYPAFPSRFVNLSDAFEFSGWGSVTQLKLERDDFTVARERIEEKKRSQVLGQFTASALAGNAVLGSVFYALPAVVAVGGVYSPISLFIATLVLFLWRPVMEELASALPISGAPYTYILNVSTKSFALIGASLLLLDFAATSVVSAATAATYLSGEVASLPFPTWTGALLVLILFTVISLMGVRESARIALMVLSFHVATMCVLVITSSVHLGHAGIGQLRENWNTQRSQTGTSVTSILRQVYYGFCLGMLGLTGFECTPSYIERIRPGKFPQVLRSLHIPAIIFNTVLMLLILAIVPLNEILGGANVLSTLAQYAGGKWLRTWIVVDAIVVLCGGVLTGILASSELFEQLAQHRILPSTFLSTMPITRAPALSIISFTTFSAIVYFSSSADLMIVSSMFSLVWLFVMSLFPVTLLILKFSRGRLRRDERATFGVIIVTIIVVILVAVGNIVATPRTAGYFTIYFIGIVTVFSLTQNKIRILRWAYWVYDQYPALHGWNATRSWDGRIIDWMARLKRQPVCILVKTDEINTLFHMILYVRRNEETSNLKIVHFYEEEDGIPSELEANAKILDEAFPEITIDLVLIQGSFDPIHLGALSHHLNVPQSLMFMTCPGSGIEHSVADLGTRVIIL